MRKLLILPVILGMANAVLAVVFNDQKQALLADVNNVLYFFTFIGIVWGFITNTIWSRVDSEWKDCEMAKMKNDKETFFLLASIEMDPLIERLWTLFAVLTAMSFHLLYFNNIYLAVICHAGMAFGLTIAMVFIKDRDTPLSGAVNIQIPENWKQT